MVREKRERARSHSTWSRILLFLLSLLWSGAFFMLGTWAYRHEGGVKEWFNGLEWYIQALFGPLVFVGLAVPVLFVGFNIIIVPIVTALYALGAFDPAPWGMD